MRENDNSDRPTTNISSGPAERPFDEAANVANDRSAAETKATDEVRVAKTRADTQTMLRGTTVTWTRPPGDKRPVGWWNCKKCGATNNPPLGNSCLRCNATRPGCEPVPQPTPPKQPELPKQPKLPTPPVNKVGGVIKQLIAWGAVLSVGLSVASFFVPALKPIASIIKLVVAALRGLPTDE